MPGKLVLWLRQLPGHGLFPGGPGLLLGDILSVTSFAAPEMDEIL